MAHDTAHAHGHNVQPTDVNDNLATRILGILGGLIIIAALVSITKAMHWHPAACSAMCGVLGMVMGASGTSVYAPSMAAWLAYAGVTVFVFGLLVFTGIASCLF